jgi:hypothetical protein
MTTFDEARMEWEFEALREKHRGFCTGAILLEVGQWCNLIVPIQSPSYRGWDDPPLARLDDLQEANG